MDRDRDRPASQRGTGTSRRGFLVAGALGVVAAGSGVAVGVATTGDDPLPFVESPQILLGAVAAERALIAELDAARTAHPALRPMLAQLRADHAAHLSALRAAVALAAPVPNASAVASPPPAPARPANRARLRILEQRAATRAAAAALQLGGRDAVLLASIAACEATHAELLS